MESVKLGSRVFYKENGPEDTGTIIDFVIGSGSDVIVVKWDRQLSEKDERIDQYTGNQLVLISY